MAEYIHMNSYCVNIPNKIMCAVVSPVTFDSSAKRGVIIGILVVFAFVAAVIIASKAVNGGASYTSGFGRKGSLKRTSGKAVNAVSTVLIQAKEDTDKQDKKHMSEEQRLAILKERYSVVQGTVDNIEEREETTNFRADRVLRYKVYTIYYTFSVQGKDDDLSGSADINSYRPDIYCGSPVTVYYEPNNPQNNFTDYNMPKEFNLI